MAFRNSHTTSPDSHATRSGQNSCEPKQSTAPRSRVQEDEYGERDASLQSYTTDVDPSSALTHILHNANQLLWILIRDFQSKKSNPITLSFGGGVYTLRAGRETRIQVQMREDTQMVHLSAVVHNETHPISEIPSNKKRRGSGGYTLLMTMMRYNSELSRTSCGARILACNGQFVLFQDLPASVLNETGMLPRELDEFIMKTVEIARGFDRVLKEDHCRLALNSSMIH